MSRGKRSDIISVVEAAYRPADDLKGWASQLARAVRPHLGRGYGTQVAVYPWDDPQFMPSMLAGDGGPRGLGQYLLALHAAVNPDGPRSFMTRSPANRIYTYQEAAPVLLEGPNFFERYPLGKVRFADLLAVLVRQAGVSALIGAMADRRIELSAAEHRRWRLLGVHIGAGMRLQLRLDETEDVAPDAVLKPDGACAHAEGQARDRSARDALRTAARHIDRARSRLRRADEMSALSLWRGLVNGRWSLVDRFDSDGRRYLLALRNEPRYPDPRALTPRERQVANLVADGQANMEIAYALGLSESAVSSHASLALRKLGLRRREELLAVLRPLDGRTSTADVGGQTLAVSSRRLNAPVRVPGMTAAEGEVVAGVVEGLSDKQIAARRQVSHRTVANQLRSVFRKLRVGSRAELICRVRDMD